jgi:membrane fusion protein, multidrug efflux system
MPFALPPCSRRSGAGLRTAPNEAKAAPGQPAPAPAPPKAPAPPARRVPNVAHAQAVLAQAELNLSYTKIYASVSGTVANRTVQVGDFVQPGQALFSAAPNQVYVIANFKETQLTHMRVGQKVDITVDALPNLKLHGYINSFQRGTGSYFALLPPENATGNFVKVVQRVPVKIILDGTDPQAHMLAPGMSVEATVITHKPPFWLTRFID